jgi:hypothetical protein
VTGKDSPRFALTLGARLAEPGLRPANEVCPYRHFGAIPHVDMSARSGPPRRWIEGWYNARRLHSSIAYMTPNEMESAWQTDRLAA